MTQDDDSRGDNVHNSTMAFHISEHAFQEGLGNFMTESC
jgi:hypothetical protein